MGGQDLKGPGPGRNAFRSKETTVKTNIKIAAIFLIVVLFNLTAARAQNAGASPAATATATATVVAPSAQGGVPGEFYISHIIPDPEADVIRFDEGGNAIIGASHSARFKSALDAKKQECIKNHEQMSSGELLSILPADDRFTTAFTAYAICQYSINPANDFCSPNIFYKVLPDSPQPSGFKPVPQTEEQKKAGPAKLLGIEKTCKQNYLMYAMMKGLEELNGEKFSKANCKINAESFPDNAACVTAIEAFSKALAKSDPALCGGISESTDAGKYSKVLCKVWAGNDPSQCSEMKGGADFCKSLFLAYKSLRGNDPAIMDYLSSKQSLMIYPAVKASFDKGYCGQYFNTDVQPAFCAWKYDPANNDIKDYLKDDIEAAKKQAPPECAPAPKGGTTNK